ncbi:MULTISPECIES: hypothetical protein [unclassified Lentimonas]|uniref:hypothetical protein n=1 Tax=unclassified Lentimonas TaxID=2630993 RepID=UPI001328943E|nr:MULTISPECIES: hypothetical protein [unclassified Lentimonas]CAA6679297.1 Unannotated [Lentimonas sp. CC4]CAA6686333.1 Unannotated [Lentimonas sp. CC6]CAA7076108.1 Unannotated [Lentimonas sp. CC4]CAA7170899.1 Unannotated [Lentimonas sp. CC21]CAA7181158.1 Unannotated [Lentimonas sp. CC8]
MKELPTKFINLTNALLISSEKLAPKIWRYDLDQYAITVEWKKDPIFAFRSEAFSTLINSLDLEINDFIVMKCECQICQKSHDFTELRIRTEDMTLYYLDTNDCITKGETLEMTEKEAKTALSPMQKWGLPFEHPYDRMILSNNLIHELSGYTDSSDSKDIMKHLWMELNRSKTGSLVDQVITVDSEFCEFSVTELKCGRHILMTKEEGGEQD